MNDYERELKYLRTTYPQVGNDPHKISHWIHTKRLFINKYVIKFNPTDKTFNGVQNELMTMENELTKKFTQGFLF
jgi:hypothetical protein